MDNSLFPLHFILFLLCYPASFSHPFDNLAVDKWIFLWITKQILPYFLILFCFFPTEQQANPFPKLFIHTLPQELWTT